MELSGLIRQLLMYATRRNSNLVGGCGVRGGEQDFYVSFVLRLWIADGYNRLQVSGR
jgi:hypothetical protein